ncbi:MAG: CHAT domain-containing protein [Hyphomicrobium sp.]|nr:CHAT domain-containing protein [Hyphomicrobium sp.]
MSIQLAGRSIAAIILLTSSSFLARPEAIANDLNNAERSPPAATSSSQSDIERIDNLLEEGDVTSARSASDQLLSKARVGADPQLVAQALAIEGQVFLTANDNGHARSSFDEALSILRTLGGDLPDVAQSIARVLVNLAVIDELEDDDSSADRRLSEALAIQDKVLPQEHIDRAAALIGFAKVSQMRGQYSISEKFWRQARKMREALYVPGHYNIAVTLEGLAGALEAQGKHQEAEELLRQALSYRSTSNKPGNPHLASVRQHLGVNLRRQGKLKEAEVLLLQSLKLRQSSSALPGDRARNMVDLALVYISQGRLLEAKKQLEAALDIYKAYFITEAHPWHIDARMPLALVNNQLGDVKTALTLARKTSATLAARPPANIVIANIQFQDHIAYAWRARDSQLSGAGALLTEAFEIAQRSGVTSAAKSASTMAARLSATDAALQALVRNQQDESRHLAQLETMRTGARSLNASSNNEIDAMSRDIEVAERKLASLDGELHELFPAFASLVKPAPLSVKDVQSKLAKDEILVFAFVAFNDIYVWAITSEDARWTKSRVTPEAAEKTVKMLRAGLVSGPADKPPSSNFYDLGLAYSFYTDLFNAVIPLMAEKRRIYYVPTSFLSTLPLHVLIDKRPDVAKPGRKDAAAYKNAGWLIRRHEISVLPNVAVMRSFGSPPSNDQDRKTIIGFADPVYNREQHREDSPLPVSRGVPRGLPSGRAPTEATPITAVAALKTLPRLDGTRGELTSVGTALKADADDLFFGAEANEATVKLLNRQGKLASYKIIYFAMHGLTANAAWYVKGNGGEPAVTAEVGNSEPSLAMAVPQSPSGEDDGLLSTSEIAELKLNADWVVLSACDTAAGEAGDADALSGLARAFFYAGARSLIVTQWSASDSDAKEIMTKTFAAIAADPTIKRSESLRRAMLARIDGAKPGDKQWDSYPSYWAPFELVIGAN